jgi:hypothetical protein
VRAEQEGERGARLVAVGERQQEGHGGDAAEPRQHADDEAVDDADEHEEDGLRRQQGHQARNDGLEHPPASPARPLACRPPTAIRSGFSIPLCWIMTGFAATNKGLGTRASPCPQPGPEPSSRRKSARYVGADGQGDGLPLLQPVGSQRLG